MHMCACVHRSTRCLCAPTYTCHCHPTIAWQPCICMHASTHHPPPQQTPDGRHVQLERQFRILWADHGDALSWQYAGTGALKSGFTRSGKRTALGLLDDGVKSAVRYYLNNFEDGHKQDALDLVSGAYRPRRVCPPPPGCPTE